MSAGGAALRAAARDFGWLAGGQVALKLLAFGFGVWVVRALGAAEFGRYSAALAFAGLFAVATGPGAATFGTREMASDPGAARRLLADIAGLRVTLSLAVVPLLALAAWALGRPPEALAAVALAGCALPLYALVATLDSALVAHGRVALASFCAAARQVLFVLFGVVALAAGGGAVALLAAANLALVARVLITWRALRRSLGLRLARPAPAGWPALARRMLPFGVEGMADLAGLHVPMVVLSLLASEAVVGYYGAAFNLALVALPFAQGVGTALAPRLASAEGRALVPRAVGTALRLTLALGVPAAAALALWAGLVVRLLYGAAFAPAAASLRVLAWALPAMFAWEALRAGVIALRLEATAARAAVASAVVAALVAAGLAPLLGAAGAACAFLSLRVASVAQLGVALWRALPPTAARQALGLGRA
jgi:O-antigen/teichoic acid export membrane protein